MPRPKVIHTIETILARTDEVGDCLEWQGIMLNNTTPQIKSDRKLLTVRRLLRELMGNPAKPGSYLGTTCGNPKCVKPAHILERSMHQHMKTIAAKIDHNHPIRIAKLQKAKAHMRSVDEEGLMLIRTDNRRAQDLADELGCSKSVVNKIRRGDGYREIRANTFAGLLR